MKEENLTRCRGENKAWKNETFNEQLKVILKRHLNICSLKVEEFIRKTFP